MNQPSLPALFDAVDATWPPARVVEIPGWKVREGLGGGSRVSSATATGAAPDVAAMEAAQQALGQRPLVMIRAGEDALDTAMAAAGYEMAYPVTMYLCRAEALAAEPPPVTIFHVAWPPAQIQTELWAEGGIGPARIEVMGRVEGPRSAILGRASDQPAGVAFVACSGNIAMVHALEVSPALRRQKVGVHIMQAAALWAVEQGARWLAVLVTDENSGANALYANMGMQPVGRYHYRIRRSVEGEELS